MEPILGQPALRGCCRLVGNLACTFDMLMDEIKHQGVTLDFTSWRDELQKSTEGFLGAEFDANTWQAFSQVIHYCPGDIKAPEDFQSLAKRLAELEGQKPADRVYYIATMPQLYESAAAQ